MTNFQKILVGTLLVLALGLGLKGATKTSAPLGDSLTSVIATHYLNGINVGSSDQFAVDGSGNITQTGNQVVTGNDTASGFQKALQFLTSTVGSASTTSSTNPTVLLGSSAAGYITIGTSTPAGTLGQQVNASTTAIDATSQVFLQLSATTTIPGVTCNSTNTTTPIIANIFASSTNTALNGFQAKSLATPVTNPLCLYYHIIN